ncbi:MAG: hypothetical protein K9I29_05335 [Bacteroidales bacterium]|nr:hypothetical protein [Bacteroidales bacterium]
MYDSARIEKAEKNTGDYSPGDVSTYCFRDIFSVYLQKPLSGCSIGSDLSASDRREVLTGLWFLGLVIEGANWRVDSTIVR